MLNRRARLALATGVAALAATVVSPVAAHAPVKPRDGRYTAKCPQGYQHICGEAAWTVVASGTRIGKNATVPWPNDPNNPSVGICGHYNPFIAESKVKIDNGSFSYKGRSGGVDYTWKGTWVKRGKVEGTVKWHDCKTLASYIGRHD